MAEFEYKGIKMSGSKLMIILPLIGTLIGGLWGGFELYNRLLVAEKKLALMQPVQIQAEIDRLVGLTDVIKENLQGDITEAVRLSRMVETRSADTQRQIRTDVYEMEREMQKIQPIHQEMKKKFSNFNLAGETPISKQFLTPKSQNSICLQHFLAYRMFLYAARRCSD